MSAVLLSASAIWMRSSKATSNTRITQSTATTTPTGSFTVTEADYYRFWISDVSPENVVNFQLELGLIATAYEEYRGETVPISWQSEAGTVYGGNIDPITGVLTVDRAGVRLNTLTFDEHPTAANVFYTSSLEGRKLGVTNIISDMFAAVDASVASLPIGGMRGLTNNKALYFGYQAANVSAFMAAVDNSILVYELSTPQTYQLDPVTVNTLLGQNNIWADTGDSTVEYPADTKLYIDKKLAALVAALS